MPAASPATPPYPPRQIPLTWAPVARCRSAKTCVPSIFFSFPALTSLPARPVHASSRPREMGDAPPARGQGGRRRPAQARNARGRQASRGGVPSPHNILDIEERRSQFRLPRCSHRGHINAIVSRAFSWLQRTSYIAMHELACTYDRSHDCAVPQGGDAHVATACAVRSRPLLNPARCRRPLPAPWKPLGRFENANPSAVSTRTRSALTVHF